MTNRRREGTDNPEKTRTSRRRSQRQSSTREVFELLAELADRRPEECEEILAGHDADIAAQARAILDGDRDDDFLEAPAILADSKTGQPREIGPYRLLEILGEGGWAESSWPSSMNPYDAGWR